MVGIPEYNPVLGPFGANDVDRPTWELSGDVNQLEGITDAMCVPAANGGIKITRHILNELGYLCTQASFLEQCGHTYTYDATFANLIGGYPKGAILRHLEKDASDNIVAVYDLISTKDNNKDNFITTPSCIGTSWVYVNNPDNGRYIPDLTKLTTIQSTTGSTSSAILGPWTIPTTGWVLVTMKDASWPNATELPTYIRNLWNKATTYATITIAGVEVGTIGSSYGPVFTKLFPVNANDTCTVSLCVPDLTNTHTYTIAVYSVGAKS